MSEVRRWGLSALLGRVLRALRQHAHKIRMVDGCEGISVLAHGASIGEHYRHVVQHFECVIRSIHSGEINYEARERNHRLETAVTFAAIATCDVLRAIKKYGMATLNRACTVVSTLRDLASRPLFVETTVGRELAYCIGNAIHHYTIVRQIAGQIGVEVPPEFAIARSSSSLV